MDPRASPFSPAAANSAERTDALGNDEGVVQNLQTALEELRVTEEELRSQNDELISARQQVEVERQRYRDLFEFAPNAYLVTDVAGKILEANRAATEMLDVKRLALVGKPLVVYVPPDSRSSFRLRLNAFVRGGALSEWEILLGPHGGPQRNVIASVAAISPPGEGGAALRWLLRDVTDQKQAERLAVLGEMMAGLAHESRNALQRSESCLERLQWRLQDNPEALDLLARVQQAHYDLRRLYEDVRSYAGPVKLEHGTCNLADVWRTAWEDLAPRREGRDAQLLELSDLEPECDGDAFKMQQVFRNIFDNALAACADPVRVEVACGAINLAGHPAWRVRIRDNGPGLNAEQRARIFQPFYTTKPKGTGLGMAIATRIVEAHGGLLQLGHRDPPGAEFLITLPARVP